MNTHNIMKIIVIIVVIVAIFFVILGLKNNQEINIEQEQNKDELVKEKNEPIQMCYYRATPTDRGFFDVAWIKLNILDDKITGEFEHLPAESDSKVGTFEGVVGPLEQSIMGRRALVWWDSFAEGMNVKEELAIEFGDGSATVGFGEMIDRGDGVYIYKDKKNLYYIEQMGQMDCESLDEKLFAEKFVRENISTIATDKAILGGIWYVINVTVIPATHTGEVIYEDGHIQSIANFTYTYKKDPQDIVITKFEVKK